MRSFNPRPVYKPGDTSSGSPLAQTTSRFNPRPVYKPGDTTKQYNGNGGNIERFNPRPVYKPGDTFP